MSNTKLVIMLLGSSIVLLSFASWAYLSNGLPKRFDDYDNVLSYLNYDFKEAFLSHTCFLHKEDLTNKKDFSECEFNQFNNANKPTVFLWGDSNAAHLIPGIQHFYQAKNS